MGRLDRNLNNYIKLDTLYKDFEEEIDSLPLILSEEDVESIEIDASEYILKDDYKRIKNTIYQKRKSKEFMISENNDNLVSFQPYSNNDTSYFLNIIYELNESQDSLVKENKILREKITKLESELQSLKKI